MIHNLPSPPVTTLLTTSPSSAYYCNRKVFSRTPWTPWVPSWTLPWNPCSLFLPVSWYQNFILELRSSSSRPWAWSGCVIDKQKPTKMMWWRGRVFWVVYCIIFESKTFVPHSLWNTQITELWKSWNQNYQSWRHTLGANRVTDAHTQRPCVSRQAHAHTQTRFAIVYNCFFWLWFIAT